MRLMSIVPLFAALCLSLALGLVPAGCALEREQRPPRTVLHTTVAPAWIWSRSAENGEALERESATFRCVFQVDDAVMHAALVATCDNELVLELDGEVVLTSNTWEMPVACDVTPFFASGAATSHELLAHCRNAGG